jgi:putative membrane protein
MKLATAFAAAALLTLPQAASAQGAAGTGTTAAPSRAETPAGVPGAAAGTTQRLDAATFIRSAASGNMLEIESSKLAVQQGKRDDVKAFAQMMVNDHTNATQKMQQVIAGRAPSATSAAGGTAAMESRHQAMLQELSQANAANFDQAYILLQRNAHQEALALFTNYARSGDDPQLKSFAAEMLPVLQKHAQAANALGR